MMLIVKTIPMTTIVVTTRIYGLRTGLLNVGMPTSLLWFMTAIRLMWTMMMNNQKTTM